MRYKKIYKLAVPEKLTDIGFPTEFHGKRAVNKGIKVFIINNLELLIKLYHPNIETLDELGRVVDHLTWREMCEKESMGHTYWYAKEGVGYFTKEVMKTPEQESRIDLLRRSMEDEITNRDYLGYLPSFKRYEFESVANTIIRVERDRAIRDGYYFNSILDIKGENTMQEMVEYGVIQSITHSILDDIINEDDLLPAPEQNTIWSDLSLEIKDLTRLLDNEEITTEDYILEITIARSLAYDEQFSRRRSIEEIARFVDTKRDATYGNIDASKTNKIIRMNRALIEQPKPLNKYEKKKERIESHFYHNPDSTITFASKELGISRDTIKKYKPAMTKVAPKVSSKVYILDVNGATLVTPHKAAKNNNVLNVSEGLLNDNEKVQYDPYI